MASTFTPNLRFNKQGVGDNVGLWGGVVNTQFDLLEDAIASNVSVALVAGNNTLTTADGTVDNARHFAITFSGALAAAASVIAPDVQKMFVLQNNTTGGQTITFKNSAGTGVVVPSGGIMTVYCDGTSVRQLTPTFSGGSPSFTTVSAAVGNFGSLGVLTTVSASVGIFNAGLTATSVGTSVLSATVATITSANIPTIFSNSTINANVVNCSARLSALVIQGALVSTSALNVVGVVSVGTAVNVPTGRVSASAGSFTTIFTGTSGNALTYTQGSFTPVIVGSSVAGTGTYAQQTGRFTRIGDRVDVYARVQWTAHTGTGELQLTGCPVTAALTTPLIVNNNGIASPANSQVKAVIAGTSILFYSETLATGALAFLAMDTSAEVFITGTYFV